VQESQPCKRRVNEQDFLPSIQDRTAWNQTALDTQMINVYNNNDLTNYGALDHKSIMKFVTVFKKKLLPPNTATYSV
jgi:hypothetical protein